MGVRALRATLMLATAAILAAGLVFATLSVAIGVDGGLARADQALTDGIRRSASLPMLKMFAAITVLANTAVLWALAIVGTLVLVWRRAYLLACVWVAAIGGNGIVTTVLKNIFERDRPHFEHELFKVQGWSFPSGHSSGAIVAYGILAYVLIRCTPVVWHLPIVLLGTAIAFTTGCSRIFLQVHYASDVAAGFASGLAWLAVCVMTAELLRRRIAPSN